MDQYIEIKEFAKDYTNLHRQTYRIGVPQPFNVSIVKAGVQRTAEVTQP
jgi:hypothetical protein